jgi:large subunit ribosomal protein L30e
MAKKQEQSSDIQLLKAQTEAGTALIGTERVLKELKKGAVSKVLIASNCPDNVKEDLQRYAGLQDIPVVLLEQSNEELGVICKKNFFVAVAAIVQ